MEALVKGIKFIRLAYTIRDGIENYLTTCEDEKGVALTTIKGESEKTENMKWRMQWLPSGKCYFWSCYNKVLAVGAGTSTNNLIAFQSKWLVEKGTSAEWYPKFSIDFVGVLEAKLNIRHGNQGYFLEGSFDGNCKVYRNVWYEKMWNIKWDVQVIETTTTDQIGGYSDELARHPRYSGRDDAVANKNFQEVMGYLSHWKVEQVVFYAGHGGGGGGGGGGALYNSGENSNGSGTQNNGDVKVLNQIGNNTRFYLRNT